MRPLCYARNFQIGFTLIEVLVTITMLAILLAIAAPNLRTFFVQNQMASLSNEFIAAVNLARTEAMKLGPGRRVGIEAKGSAMSGNWLKGWQVYVDANGDGSYNAGDTLIRQRGELDPKIQEMKETNADAFFFNAYGEVSGRMLLAGDATVAFCLDGVVRRVFVSRTARVRLEVDKVASC